MDLKIIGEIPARIGSERVQKKNLRDLAGQPLIRYAIESAKKSKLLTDIYVNTESEIIGQYALEQGVKFYKRDEKLASSDTKQDEFNYDFIVNTDVDILVLINPVCPLITGSDIDAVIQGHLQSKNTVTITCMQQQLHAFSSGKPINFSIDKMLPKTQDIPPIVICTWSIAIWNALEFKKQYEEYGCAVFFGKIGLFPLPFLKSIKISTEEEFILADTLIKNNIIQSTIEN
jgi:CMP-N,N'-diacetyllegionaminic acid synthase